MKEIKHEEVNKSIMWVLLFLVAYFPADVILSLAQRKDFNMETPVVAIILASLVFLYLFGTPDDGTVETNP